jgi:hypothetical protein
VPVMSETGKWLCILVLWGGVFRAIFLGGAIFLTKAHSGARHGGTFEPGSIPGSCGDPLWGFLDSC